MAYYDETVVRQIYEAFNRHNMEAVSKVYAENVTIHVPGRSQISGDYHGKQALIEFWEKQFELSSGTFQPQVITVTDGEGHIVVITDIRVRRGEKEYTWRRAIDFRMQEGQVQEASFFEGDQYAADEAFR